MVCCSSAAEQTCILQKASVGDSINCIARIDLHCDWSFQIPVVNSHMTLTELRSDWNAQIPSPAQGLCPYTYIHQTLFPRRGWGWERD